MKFVKMLFGRSYTGRSLRTIIIAGLLIYIMLMVCILPRSPYFADASDNNYIEKTVETFNDNYSEKDVLNNQFFIDNENEFPQEVEAEDEFKEIEDIIKDKAWKETEPLSVVKEVEEKRTADTKHFLMSNGTFTMVCFSEPVHYLDEKGKYRDINNTLIEKDGTYTNTDNNFKVALPKNYSEKMTTISIDDCQIGFSLADDIAKGKAVSKVVSQKNIKKIDKNEKNEIELKTCSSIQYTLNKEQIEIEQILRGQGLKENIIINSPINSYIFNFDISVKNINLSLNEAGDIDAFDATSGKKKFKIPKGYMFDAKNNFSNDVVYKLEEKKTGYRLKVIASEEWINSAERAFPVTIDPTITLDNPSIVTTASRESHQGNTMYITSGEIKSFVRFNIPDFLIGNTVFSATMRLGILNWAEATQVNIYECNTDWSTTAPSYPQDFDQEGAIPEDCLVVPAKFLPYYRDFNVTKSMKNIIEYGWPINYGYAIGLANSSYTLEVYNENTSMGPQLCVNYRPMVGLESYWEYDTYSIKDTNLYVNKYNGQVTTIHNIMSSGDETSINVQLVHLDTFWNQPYKTYDTSTGQESYPYEGNYGNGWKLNYIEVLIPHNPELDDNQNIINADFEYYDADGTLHWFFKNNDGFSYDEDGLGLQIISNYLSSDSYYCLVNKAGDKKVFTSYGRLRYISDVNDYQITLTYETVNNKSRLNKISNSRGFEAVLTYDASGYLIQIEYLGAYDSVKVAATFSYVNGNLSRVTMPDSTYTDYGYDEYGITTITDNDGKGIRINELFFMTCMTDASSIPEITISNMFMHGKRIYEKGNVSSWSAIKDTVYFGDLTMTLTGKDGNSLFYEGTSGGEITTRFTLEDWALALIVIALFSQINPSIIDKIENNRKYFCEENFATHTVFDSTGRVVSEYVAAQDTVTAYKSQYIQSGNNKNKVSQTASYQASVINLIKDGSFEHSNHLWIASSTNAVGGYSDVAAVGGQSLKISASSTQFRYYYQQITLNKGEYTFSAYVHSDCSDTYLDTSSGAFLQLEYGNSLLKSERIIKDVFQTNNTFRQVFITFAIESDNTIVTLKMVANRFNGFALFDGVQLIKSKHGVIDTVNYMEDPGFENSNAGLSSEWTISAGSGTSYGIEDHSFSGRGLYLIGNTNSTLSLMQKVRIDSKPVQSSYAISFWVNTNGYVYSPKSDSKVALRYRALQTETTPFSGNDGNYKLVYIRALNNQWSQLGGILTVPANAWGIEVYVVVNYSPTKLRLDSFSVTQTQINNYEYNADGIISSYDNGKNGTKFFKDDNSASLSQDTGDSYNVILNSDGTTQKVTTVNNGTSVSYTYDSRGNVTQVTTANDGYSKSKVEKSSISYELTDSIGTLTATDSLSFKTISTYTGFMETLRRTKNPDGSYVEYDYDDGLTHKNIFSHKNLTLSGVNSLILTGSGETYTVFVKPNTNYTFSCNRSISGPYKTKKYSIAIYALDGGMAQGTRLASIYPSDVTSVVLTFNTGNATAIAVELNSGAGTATIFNSGYLSTVTTRFTSMQLEEGSTNTSFVDYVAHKRVKTITITQKGTNGTDLSTATYEYFVSTDAANTSQYGYRQTGALKNVTLGNGTVYSYKYDQWGNIIEVKINGSTVVTNTYRSTDGVMVAKKYANDYTEYYLYDTLGRNYAVKAVSTPLSSSVNLDIQQEIITALNSATLLKDYYYDFSISGNTLKATDKLNNDYNIYGYENGSLVIVGSGNEYLTTNYLEQIYDVNLKLLEERTITVNTTGTYSIQSSKHSYDTYTDYTLDEGYLAQLQKNVSGLSPIVYDGGKIECQANSFLISSTYYSMIDPALFVPKATLHLTYSIQRKEISETEEVIGGIIIAYTDGTYSDSVEIPNDTSIHTYTLISDPEKTISKVYLQKIVSLPVILSNVKYSIGYWNKDYALTHYDTSKTAPVTMSDETASDGTKVTNIIQTSAYQHTVNNVATSLVSPSSLANAGRITLKYAIRRLETGVTTCYGLQFTYSDNTVSDSVILPEDNAWHFYTILSQEGKTVSKIAFPASNSDIQICLGNVRIISAAQKTNDIVAETQTINGYKKVYSYDALGRIIEQSVKNANSEYDTIVKEQFEYKYSSSNASDIVKTFKVGYGYNSYTLKYYYNMENDSGSISTTASNPYNIRKIESISSSGTVTTLVEYYYDQRGRLIRENNFESNFTAIYAYTSDGSQSVNDNNNLYSKKKYSVCTAGQDTPTGTVTMQTYSYGNNTFKDRLTNFNGQAISYDSMGNPTWYKNNSIIWNGRQMTSYGSYSYAYDVEGMRKSKTVSGIMTKYTYLGTRLISETKSNNTISYVYSEDDLVGFVYNNTSYFYIRNLQGDVINVIDQYGYVYATYKYDAWGKVLSASGSMANVNPIRYRGYYYDTETNLYYLNSRYYDPETGRFISPDILAEAGNIYAYCQNDPVNKVDGSGCSSVDIKGWWRSSVATVTKTASDAAATIGNGLMKAKDVVVSAGKEVAGFVSDMYDGLKNVNFNIFNTDTSKVKNNRISFFKGEMTIQIPGGGLIQDRSGSFGVMFLNTSGAITDDIINHERGHFTQLSLMGPVKYLLGVGIPSAVSGVVLRELVNSSCISASQANQIYYSLPWDRAAEIFGGTNNSGSKHLPYSGLAACLYTVFLMVV